MPPPPPERPTDFGKYQLLEKIAVGGMAEIYRARYVAAAGVTKPVVIKKILPHFAGNPAFVSMFANEARIVVGLSHGNIAQVFDFGEVDGDWFLAMELVDGYPLSKVIRRAREAGLKQLPIPIAVLIAMEVARGLHYAHTRRAEDGKPLDIVHRDVSPQNVILSFEGQVKIVDFGIAKARLAGRAETQAGAVKGKYVYFAPEQARGKTLDARTDVFALGIVLFEMLCGRLPFEGKMMDVMRQIVHGELPRPRSVNPRLPVALESLLLQALAHEPKDRFASAQAFHDALAAFLSSHSPGFNSVTLGHLLQHLYAEELVGSGRSLAIPAEFEARFREWRAPGRSGSEDVEDEKHTEATVEDDPRARRRTRLLFFATPVVAALVAALALFALVRSEPGPHVIATEAIADATSGMINPSHRAEADLDGAAPGPELVEAETGAEILTASARAPIRFALSLEKHALLVPSSGAARIRMKPELTYTLTAEGARAVAYFVEGEVSEALRSGVLSDRPLTIRGANALYALLLDDAASEAAVQIVPTSRGGVATMLRLDPARHSVKLGGDRAIVVEQLEKARYVLLLSLSEGPAALNDRAPVSSVLAVGPFGAQRIEVGRPFTFDGPGELRLAFLDDSSRDNHGTLNVELHTEP